MKMLSTARRVGVSVAGIVGVAAITVACSSTSNGTPQPGGSISSAATTSASASFPSVASSVSVPTMIPPSSAEVPTFSSSAESSTAAGGSDSQFCAAFTSSGASSLPTGSGSSANLKKVAAVWAKIAQEAPSAIKSDAQLVSDFLQGYANGKIDAAAAQKATPAIQRVLKYFTSHCTGG